MSGKDLNISEEKQDEFIKNLSQGFKKSQDLLQKLCYITDDNKKWKKSNLENILKEAKSYGFTPILRGFKDGSYKETVVFLQEIMEKINYGVVIDPESFKEFDVKLVPTFVVTKEQKYRPNQEQGI